jgi:hypothetical protein
MSNVIRFPTKPTEPKIDLVRDPETGLFCIVCDCVQVFGPLDPIGQRELIRKAALWDTHAQSEAEGERHG